MKKRIFTKSEQETIIKYYRMPYTLTETAHHFKLIRSQVRRILQDNNIHIRTLREANQSCYKIDTQFFFKESENLSLLSFDANSPMTGIIQRSQEVSKSLIRKIVHFINASFASEKEFDSSSVRKSLA